MEITDLIIEFLDRLWNGLPNSEVQYSWVWIPMVISAIASGASAAASGAANRKNKKKLKAMEAENREDFIREYYRGALDNEGSRAYLKKLDERMKRSDSAAENALTAKGATHENALAVKQSNNEIYSNAVSDLIEQEQGRKDQAKAQYKNNQMGIAEGQMQQNTNEANTWAQVGQGITNAASAVTATGGWEDLTNRLKKD